VWDRIPRNQAGRIEDVFREPPDIAVEIVSPEQRVNALIRRCLWYVANGVRLALLVDPDDESVILFRPGAEPAALRGTDTIDFSEVLPGTQLAVQELFESLSV
jgi:Uma2 family endonuclease